MSNAVHASQNGAYLDIEGSFRDWSDWYLREHKPDKSSPMHDEMCDLLPHNKRLVFEAPRGFAKSVTCTFAWPLHELLTNSKVSLIIVVSETYDIATILTEKIQCELEVNRWIHARYGNGRTTDWAKSDFKWKRADGSICRVVSRGSGGQIRSLHPDLLIIDDLENDEGVRSEPQRAYLKAWFDRALLPTRTPNAQTVMVGTPLHPLSLLRDVMARKDWIVRTYTAITPDGKSLWPARWPIEMLRELEDDMGWQSFQQEYMCNPIINENPIFRESWFRHYDRFSPQFQSKLKEGMYTVITVDPAASQKTTADYTAIGAFSATYSEPFEVYCRPEGTVRARMLIHEVAQKVIDLYDKMSANKLIVETVAYQKALAQEIRRICEEQHRFINIEEVIPDKDKERRAMTCQRILERGQVFFDSSDPLTKTLITEFCMFPTGTFDDMVDMGVMALRHLQDWYKRPSKQSGSKPRIMLPRARNEYTGVC